MKEKIWFGSLIALFFTIIILIGVLIGKTIFSADLNDNYYPRTAVVTNVNYNDDIVEVTDHSGNIWEFYGVEDWNEGDICSMIMDNKNTPNITDDEIVRAHYGGAMP